MRMIDASRLMETAVEKLGLMVMLMLALLMSLLGLLILQPLRLRLLWHRCRLRHQQNFLQELQEQREQDQLQEQREHDQLQPVQQQLDEQPWIMRRLIIHLDSWMHCQGQQQQLLQKSLKMMQSGQGGAPPTMTLVHHNRVPMLRIFRKE